MDFLGADPIRIVHTAKSTDHRARKNILFVCTRCEAVVFFYLQLKIHWVESTLIEMICGRAFYSRNHRTTPHHMAHGTHKHTNVTRMKHRMSHARTHARTHRVYTIREWLTGQANKWKTEEKLVQVTGKRLTNNKLMNLSKGKFWCTICLLKHQEVRQLYRRGGKITRNPARNERPTQITESVVLIELSRSIETFFSGR